MRYLIGTTITFFLFIAIATTGLAQTQTPAAQPEVGRERPSDQAPMLELIKLRADVVRLSIELQEWKIRQYERELQELVTEQQRLMEEEQGINLHFAELDKASGSPLREGQSNEIETLRSQLTSDYVSKFKPKQQSVNQRQADLTNQLQQAQQRLQGLVEEAHRLGLKMGESAR